MNFIKLLGVAAVSSMLFSSCLKDTPVTDYSDSGIKPIVLIPNGNWPKNQEITPLAVDYTTEPYELRVYARVSWDKPLGKNVDVTFKVDNSLITDYNTKFGTSWSPLNTDAYQATALTVTIPAGQQEAYIPIKIFPNKVNLTQDNMIAFTMESATGQTIASNFKAYVVPLLIKNIYDADYSVTGYFFHPSSPRGIARDKHIYTVSDVRSEVELGDLGGSGYYFRFDVVGGNMTNWIPVGAAPTGAASGFFTADNPGGIAYPGPEFPGQGTWKQTTYNNTYNAASHTFYTHYGYGSGAASPSGWSRNVYEKWVRQ